MLFFKFLWLFYLMVLINGYTISKSNANEDTSKEFVDSLREEEARRQLRPRRHRLLRARAATEPAAPTEPDCTADGSTRQTTTAATSIFHHYWEKFHKRNRTRDKSKQQRRLRFEMQTTLVSSEGLGVTTANSIDKNKREASTIFGELFMHPKDFFDKTKNNQFKYFNMSTWFPPFTSNTSNLDNTTLSWKPTLDPLIAERTSTNSTSQANEIMDEKTSAGWKTTPVITATEWSGASGKTTSATTSTEWVGTAQLEVLLDSIKARALQILVDQNPIMSSLVTTTSNEVSFEADPILHHIEGTTPTTHSAILAFRDVIDSSIANLAHYANSTESMHQIHRRSTADYIYNVSQTIEDALQQEIKNVYKKLKCKVCHYAQKKQKCPTTESNITHNDSSIGCGLSTKLGNPNVTTDVPQTSQKEKSTPIATVCKKKTMHRKHKDHTKPASNTPEIRTPSKNHTSIPHTTSTLLTTSGHHTTCEFHSTPILQTFRFHTVPERYKKKKTHIRSALHLKFNKEIVKKSKDSSRLEKLQNRVVKASRLVKKKKKVKNTSPSASSAPSSSLDDVTLLGLLEKMLGKTNEDNVLRLLTTPYLFGPKANFDRLSKRNIETLSDLKLKEQVHDYGELVPNYDYYDYGHSKSNSQVSTPDLNTDTEPINLEGISEKISYNDYVNGYKYYLKFQKEQELDDEKFSPMVRYQAHRHHKVDDIGKFILHRLPQVRPARNIFEDIDIDDQDISTNSDESWFRKHFYLFLDTTPRKFHTSETVALKSGHRSPGVNPHSQPRKPSKGFAAADGHHRVRQESDPLAPQDVSLDQLSQNLERYKDALSTSTRSSLVSNLLDKIGQKPVEPQAENGFIIKMIDILLGGKERRALKKSKEKTMNIDYQVEPRLKRNAQKKSYLGSTTPMKPAGNPSRSDEHKDKLSNMGFVQMIAQPTTVVKIQGKKKHRFKNFMKKLHLRKKNDKTNEKAKRHGIRKRSFVPFKKLKEMFLGSQHEIFSNQNNQPVEFRKGVSDYDLITSEINTFKMIKFDSMPKIEEMRKEIANISVDFLVPDMNYTTDRSDTQTVPMAAESSEEDVTITEVSEPEKSPAPAGTEVIDINNIDNIANDVYKDMTDLKKMTMSELENFLYGYRNSIKGYSSKGKQEYYGTKSPNMSQKSILESLRNLEEKKIQIEGPSLASSKLSEREKPVLESVNNQKENQLQIDQGVSTDNSIETLENFQSDSESSSKTEMDVIRSEVDKLKNKLTLYDTLGEYKTSTTPKSKSKMVHFNPNKEKTRKIIPQRITRIIFVPDSTQHFCNKTLPAIKKKKVVRAALFRKNSKIEKSDAETSIEFPNMDNLNDVKFIKNSKTFKPLRRDSSSVAKKKNVPQYNSNPNTYVRKYSFGPDHYRDLLLWHGDIANADSVTMPNFSIENSLGLSSFTTPNADQLADEVQDMKRFIQSLSSTLSTNTNQTSTPDFGASNDHSIVTEKKVVGLDHPDHKMLSICPTTESTTSIASSDNAIVFVEQAQYLSISRDGNLDLGLALNKSELPKKSKIKTSPIHAHAKRVSLNSVVTNLHPRSNVIHTRSPPSRYFGRGGYKRMENLNNAKKLQLLPPTLKINKVPVQYFTTPLPMNSRDFHHFLKEYNLDIESVTAPLSEVDLDVNMKSETLLELPHLNNDNLNAEVSNKMGVVNNNKSKINFLTDTHKQKTSSKNLPRIAATALKTANRTRFRRKRSHSREIQKQKIKQRRILFSNKEKALIPVTAFFSNDYKVEPDNVTDYTSNNSEDLQKYPNEVVREQPMIEMPKHNNLLYFFVDTNNTAALPMTSSTTTTTPAAPETSFTMGLLRQQTADRLLQRLCLKPKHPKRVRISYHYDIVYENRPRKSKEHGSINKYNRQESDIRDRDRAEIATDYAGHDGMLTLAGINRYTETDPKSSQREVWDLSKNKYKRMKRKSKRHADVSKTTEVALAKRNLSPVTFTAQNVAAFEVYLDVSPSTPMADVVPREKNAFQVHIALPHQQQNVKRQLNPPRPIFSAKMSDPVNLEYQVPIMEEKLYPTKSDAYLSPGLYMLVDNYLQPGYISLKPVDNYVQPGYITLKPVMSDLSLLKQRQVTTEVPLESTPPKCVTTNNANDLKKVKLNKDFVAAINKHLVQLYDNFTSLNNANKNVKKSALSNEKTSNGPAITKRSRRDIWPSMKDILLGERTCQCHFKANQTLCPACVATDAVVDELVFEFSNLANFVNDHCTELQTFFWMNPAGGKKLSDSVHRLDRTLSDYYKRVKGKCQGKTCQTLAGCLNKREINKRRRVMRDIGLLPKDLHIITSDLANAFQHRIPYNERLKKNVQYFFNVVDNCLPGVRLKQRRRVRSFHPFIPFTKNNSKTKIKRYGNKKPDYKREESQIEQRQNAIQTGTSSYNMDGNYNTELSNIDLSPLFTTTDSTMNAITHNLSELFLLFKNMNNTNSHSLQESESEIYDNKNKKGKRRKMKFNIFRRKKNKTTTTTTTTTDIPLDIKDLLSHRPESTETTRALRVIVSNFKEKPALYVTVDNITPKTTPVLGVMVPAVKASTMWCNHFETECTSQCPHHTVHPCRPCDKKNKISDGPTKLCNGECILFEEGCHDRYNFLHRVQKLVDYVFNNTRKNYMQNYSYNKSRIARTPGFEAVNVSFTSRTMIIKEDPSLGESSEGTTDAFLKLMARTNSECATQAGADNVAGTNSKYTNIDTQYDTRSATTGDPIHANKKLPIKTNKVVEPVNEHIIHPVENTEDGITDAIPTAFPTIIIIDESSTDSASNDVIAEVMSQYNDNCTTYNRNFNPRDLLLSILSFEKEKLDEEWNQARGSRGLRKLKPKKLLGNTVSGKKQSYAEGNYNILHDIKKIQKKVRKKISKTAHKSCKIATKHTIPVLSNLTMMTVQMMKGTERQDMTTVDTMTKNTALTDKMKQVLKETETKDLEANDPEIEHSDNENLASSMKDTTMLNTAVKTPEEGQTTSMSEESTSTQALATSITTPKVKAPIHKQKKTAVKEANQQSSEPKKACDAQRISQVCDLSATIENILELQHTLPLNEFEQHVRNLECYSYKRTPRCYVIKKDKMLERPEEKNKIRLKWNWVRSERASDGINRKKTGPFGNDAAPEGNYSKNTAAFNNVLVNFVVEEDFEKFYKGEHGIYRTEDNKRRRRTADAMDLTKELTDLPPLQSAPNEILAMDGDPVVLHCKGMLARENESHGENVKWVSEPDVLMRRPNLKVEGNTLHFDRVRRSNAGSYICKEGDRVRRSVQLTVLALPTFLIVSTPMYSIKEGTCTYNDLRALRSLSAAMSRLVCPRGHCSVAVHAPDCLRDMSDGSVIIRAIESLSVSLPAVRCGAGCRRDLAAQLVRLAVEGVPTLVSVDVFMEGVKNKTLVPITREGPFAVTRKLKRRGISRQQRRVSPGSVDVTVRCQRGFRLLPSLKICVADTPAARKAESRRRQQQRPTRRYDWWWYPPCGYCAACACALGACGACAACALLAHLMARGDERARKDGWAAPANNRPVSPSRVILARLFKRSLSAFRHTDSQETRSFPSKPAPPPLPPIDFD